VGSGGKEAMYIRTACRTRPGGNRRFRNRLVPERGFTASELETMAGRALAGLPRDAPGSPLSRTLNLIHKVLDRSWVADRFEPYLDA
jgi:hypothetical protein